MILVTGGTGLVGAHLLYRLVQDGQRPRAIYRTEKSLAKARKVFSYYATDWKKAFDTIHWVVADINDIVALEQAFKGITHVFHAAALISFDPKDYKKLLHVNVAGTANVVNAGIAAQVKKICYVSSIAALGSPIGNKEVTEATEWNMDDNNGYAISKHLGEMEVWRASQEGIDIAIINPGVVIGIGSWKTGSGLLFSTAWKAPSHYLPNGTGFVTVNDVVMAMVLLMQSEVKNERFILVNRNMSYQQIMELLAIGLGKKPPKKELRSWQLELLWRLDWCYSLCTGKPRRLSKKMVRLFNKQDIYNNQKLPSLLPQFSYGDLEKQLAHCCAIFLRERES